MRGRIVFCWRVDTISSVCPRRERFFPALLGDASTDVGDIPGLRDEPEDKVRKVLEEVKALHQI